MIKCSCLLETLEAPLEPCLDVYIRSLSEWLKLLFLTNYVCVLAAQNRHFQADPTLRVYGAKNKQHTSIHCILGL